MQVIQGISRPTYPVSPATPRMIAIVGRGFYRDSLRVPFRLGRDTLKVDESIENGGGRPKEAVPSAPEPCRLGSWTGKTRITQET